MWKVEPTLHTVGFLYKKNCIFIHSYFFWGFNCNMWMLAGKFDFKIVFEKIQFECFDHNLIKGTEINRI